MKVRSVTPGQGAGRQGAPPGSHSAGRQAVRVSIPTREKQEQGRGNAEAGLAHRPGSVRPGQSRHTVDVL